MTQTGYIDPEALIVDYDTAKTIVLFMLGRCVQCHEIAFLPPFQSWRCLKCRNWREHTPGYYPCTPNGLPPIRP